MTHYLCSICDEFKKFVTIKGRVNQGLINRRNAEANCYFYGRNQRNNKIRSLIFLNSSFEKFILVYYYLYVGFLRNVHFYRNKNKKL